MLPSDLEDWISDAGGEVVEKRVQGAELTPDEQLLYEVWLFDTQQRNGGISQYFCNYAERWPALRELAGARLPSFVGLARSIERALGSSTDPYEAITDSSARLDTEYGGIASAMVSELRAALRGSRPPEAG